MEDNKRREECSSSTSSSNNSEEESEENHNNNHPQQQEQVAHSDEDDSARSEKEEEKPQERKNVLYLRPSKLSGEPPPPPLSVVEPVPKIVLQTPSFLRPSKLTVDTPPVAVTPVVPPPPTEKTISFVPLERVAAAPTTATTTATTTTATTEEAKKEFRFGENLSQRVFVDPTAPPSTSNENTRKRKITETDSTTEVVTTGEEGEVNVIQINVKLYNYDASSQSYVERGRGELRLNDRKTEEVLTSRLIIRTKGSLRLMLNTQVWEQMAIERAGDKCLRFSAVEENEARIFIVMGNVGEMDSLYNALECRIKQLSKKIKKSD